MNSASLNVQSGVRWYAIQTKGNKEREVHKRLCDLKLEVFLPWLRARRRIGSKFHWVNVPLFPGYLFCRLDMETSGKAARYSPGVKDFLKFGSEIVEVSSSIIDALRERCPDGVAQFEALALSPGQSVKITEGPFAGLEAVFEKKMKGSDRVAVLLDILGRQTRLILPTETVGKA